MITETWFTENHNDAEILLSGYKLYRMDRKGRGGGVMIFCRENLKPVEARLEHNGFCDTVSCLLNPSKGLSVLVTAIYRSTSPSQENNDKLILLLDNFNRFNATYKIILGDFNLPLIRWTEGQWPPSMDRFMDAVQDCFLSQVVLHPTREQNVLDLIFTDASETVEKVEILDALGNSDHFTVCCTFTWATSRKEMIHMTYDYRKADWQLFVTSIEQSDFADVFAMENIDDSWDRLTEKIMNCVKLAIPMRESGRRKGPPWASATTFRSFKAKHNAFLRFKREGTVAARARYKEATKRLKYDVNHAVLEYERKIASDVASSKKAFWSYARKKQRNQPSVGSMRCADGSLVEEPKEVAQVLANFFESVYVNEGDGDGPAIERTVNQAFSTCTFSAEDLIKALSEKNGMSLPGQDGITYLMLKKGGRHLAEILSMFFQKSLRAGYVPMAWRSAIIKPIFKKGSTEEPSNYRPVCLTSTVGKLMESVIREKMLAFWLENDAINPSQHGFLPNKSCTTNLLMYMDELTKLVDSGKPVDSIYLDFSKAFDTVPHRRLLSKLQSLGIEGSMLRWIESFLNDRCQFVLIQNEKSETFKPSSGVPQGSVLGPLLFVAFVNDLDTIVMNASLLKYADDLKLFMPIKKNDPGSTLLLQEDLSRLKKWSDDWLLEFNIAKCSTLHFGNGNPEATYYIGQMPLATKMVERDLGVQVSTDLKMHSQVMKCVRTAQNVLWSIKRTITSRDKDIIRSLYVYLVRPHLEVSSPVWNPHMKRDIQLLEEVQRRATKLIPELKRLPYEERLKQLNLQTLETRRKRQDFIEMYKILRGRSTISRNMFAFPSDRTRRTSHSFALKKHRFHLDCRGNVFANRLVNEWNALPEDIINAKSISEFKKKIDKFL